MAGFRGFKLMEINSNGCFPGIYIILYLHKKSDDLVAYTTGGRASNLLDLTVWTVPAVSRFEVLTPGRSSLSEWFVFLGTSGTKR